MERCWMVVSVKELYRNLNYENTWISGRLSETWPTNSRSIFQACMYGISWLFEYLYVMNVNGAAACRLPR